MKNKKTIQVWVQNMDERIVYGNFDNYKISKNGVELEDCNKIIFIPFHSIIQYKIFKNSYENIRHN
jgi:hypothetical protein